MKKSKKWDSLKLLKLLGWSLLLLLLSFPLLSQSRNLWKKLKANFQTAKKSKLNYIAACFEVFEGTEYEKYIPYILAQAMHESNDFTSRLAKEQYNFFGMKESSIRQTTDLDSPLHVSSSEFPKDMNGNNVKFDKIGYSEYVSPYAGYQDFLLWLRYVKFPTEIPDLQEWAFQMKERYYYEDSFENYSNGMLAMLDLAENKYLNVA